MKAEPRRYLVWAALCLTACSFFVAPWSFAEMQAIPPDRVATPSPSPVASPGPIPLKVQTLDELRAAISRRMLDLEVRRGRVGVKIVSLNSGKTVFDYDADKYFMPASNMKNFTVAAALEKLGPNFKFVTSVYGGSKPDANGTLKGDLRVYGRGDVSVSTAFNNGDYYKSLDNLADKIAAAGVRRVEGDLVGDEGYFTGFAIPVTWEWDDLQWYDGAEVSALSVNNNAVDLSIKPAGSGQPCVVTVMPPTSLMPVINTCTTTKGGARNIKVFKSLGRNALEVSGTMPSNDNGWAGYVAVTHPAELFVSLLKERLEKKGIVVTGRARTIATARNAPPTTTPPFTVIPAEIARLESPPFSDVAAKTMKPSQNMFTEVILWTLGEEIGRKSGRSGDSSRLGLDVVSSFLASAGIQSDAVVQYDGSGMSRHDLVTPNAVAALYTYMAKQSRNAQVWRDSLSIAGVDGTLRNRFKGTVAAGNIRGKTGTLDQVSSLSGYVTTAGGEQVVISIIVNGVPTPATRTSLIDEIALAVAKFNGRID